jgi:rubrerythrin
MKDKEKQIEEMAKEIFDICAWRFGKPNDYKEIFNDIAEDLTKLNYLKIDKDSVVLTREEYNKKKKHLESVLELSSTQFEKVVRENEKLNNKIEVLRETITWYDNDIKKIRKETAEKIFKELKVKLKGVVGLNYLDELAKQYGVDIKE